ncbi:hypothetical protein [Roseovarius sp. 217]|uniref:hypothetical protein n=1 Tax=Roseovarius sp. (strain 217) TaxID=314264 RepID=UPI0012ED27E4|nr:hypothetical protein [Roseovarius sp. 217]
MLNRRVRRAVALGAVVLQSACSDASLPSRSATGAIAEVTARDNQFADYPVIGTTYLSFDGAHGFQINYIGPRGKAWLWYPGNRRGVAEEWKLDTVNGSSAICFRHPTKSYNPITKTTGGAFACQSLALSQKAKVASLPGDPFDLASGSVPYVLAKCAAPQAFQFDLKKFGC